ncbi:MAG: D-alanyl-D-alanine endopeptidase [Gammaproteobacteria bacterium]|nr:D-alanyl-D-alanine endopeptidase [Gammaproteobacteria bacterium]
MYQQIINVFSHWQNVLGILLVFAHTAVFAETPALAADDSAAPSDIEPLSDTASEPANSLPYLSASELKHHLQPKDLFLRSSAALVMDERDNVALYERHANKPRPIASITKLMTAMVILDAQLPMDEAITITRDDRDKIRRSRSRLRFGTQLSRADMLLMALAASENRAANALGRTFPGGTKSLVREMNAKAKQLGLIKSRFMDPAGLHEKNLSTAKELAILIEAAYQYPLIREMTTTDRTILSDLKTGRAIGFLNTNRLIRSEQWDIDLSKTGFISEAGFCLVMRANVADRPVSIILLNSWGKLSKYGDANRIKTWLLQTEQKILNLKNKVAGIDSF